MDCVLKNPQRQLGDPSVQPTPLALPQFSNTPNGQLGDCSDPASDTNGISLNFQFFQCKRPPLKDSSESSSTRLDLNHPPTAVGVLWTMSCFNFSQLRSG